MLKMSKFIGWILFLIGTWMLISPQALIGLNELKWMSKYAFSGEALLGIAVLTISLYFIDIKPGKKS
jgi:hypothetical protein